jgi:hypothetical protein
MTRLAPLAALLLVALALGTAALAGNGRSAPPVEGPTLDGKRLNLASFRGRPLVVNVWSSW